MQQTRSAVDDEIKKNMDESVNLLYTKITNLKFSTDTSTSGIILYGKNKKNANFLFDRWKHMTCDVTSYDLA